MPSQTQPAGDGGGLFRPTLGEELDEPDRKRELNREIFTKIAREYDRVCKWISFGRDLKWKQKLRSLTFWFYRP